MAKAAPTPVAPPPPSAPAALAPLADILARFNAGMTWAKAQMVERDDHVDILALALAAGEHALLLGPPGTGKSMLVGLVSRLVSDALTFSTLCHASQPVEELLGPLDVAEFKAGRMIRRTTGYAPDTHIIDLDEGFKGSPVVLNSLLNLLNERIYREEGTARPAPLRTAFIASNEVAKSETAAAFIDRILLVLDVQGVQDEDNQRTLIRTVPPRARKGRAAPAATVTVAELDAITDAVYAMPITDAVEDAAMNIRAELARVGLTVSDRRMQRAMLLPRAAALLAGRATPDVDDLAVLRYALCALPETRGKASAGIMSIACPRLAAALQAQDVAAEMCRMILGSTEMADGETPETCRIKLKAAALAWARLAGFDGTPGRDGRITDATYSIAEYKRAVAAAAVPPAVLAAGQRIVRLWDDSIRGAMAGKAVRS